MCVQSIHKRDLCRHKRDLCRHKRDVEVPVMCVKNELEIVRCLMAFETSPFLLCVYILFVYVQ